MWTGGNHDNHRFPTRWCKNDPARTRAALVMLLGLRGTPFLYYGDEIGMVDTDVPTDRILDPVGVFHGARMGRDDERTPMQWSPEPGAGFSEPGVEPWLPYGDYAAYNVADQRHDPDSTLSLTRDLIGLRDAMPELRDGSYRTLPGPNDDVWAWLRGERTVVACNLSDDAVEVADVGPGAIRISTIRARDDERVDGALRLAPWEAAIVWPRRVTGIAPWLVGARRRRGARVLQRGVRRGRHRTQHRRFRHPAGRATLDRRRRLLGPDRCRHGATRSAHGRPVRMILSVDDPDAVFARAFGAGATVVNAMYEGHGWRIGRVADPFGHHWEIGRRLE